MGEADTAGIVRAMVPAAKPANLAVLAGWFHHLGW